MMVELISSPYFIAGLFFIVAFAYSSVGLGGGSSYTALMAVMGFNTLTIPMVSLSLNLLVTTLGSYNFIRYKHAHIRLILPFLITSIPMAYVGGALQLPTEIFYWLLLASLVFVALRIYFGRRTALSLNLSNRDKLIVALVSGALLGLVAGMLGIGGGIYLVPLIILLGLGTAKEAAACGVIFIWVNSLSGLVSRLQHNAIDLSAYIPMIIAVLIGGALGSYTGAVKYPPRVMEKVLGIIILVAIGFLLRKLILI
ncbi:MAG: sulfite exporter TauE/SafE family protein [Thioalkalispiraceae bacterium]|jgi:hypothetical protein